MPGAIVSNVTAPYRSPSVPLFLCAYGVSCRILPPCQGIFLRARRAKSYVLPKHRSARVALPKYYFTWSEVCFGGENMFVRFLTLRFPFRFLVGQISSALRLRALPSLGVARSEWNNERAKINSCLLWPRLVSLVYAYFVRRLYRPRFVKTRCLREKVETRTYWTTVLRTGSSVLVRMPIDKLRGVTQKWNTDAYLSASLCLACSSSRSSEMCL